MKSSSSRKAKGRREPMSAFEYSGSDTPTQASGKTEISSAENQLITCKLQLITPVSEHYLPHKQLVGTCPVHSESQNYPAE